MLHPVGKLVIDLAALQENYQILQNKLQRGRCGATLKANAYGVGAAEAAKALYEVGCRDFFVAKPQEGLALAGLPKDGRVYILNGFYQSQAGLYVEHGLIPVVGSFIEVEAYAVLGRKVGRLLPAYLKFNTGMHRLGFGQVEQDKIMAEPDCLNGIGHW